MQRVHFFAIRVDRSSTKSNRSGNKKEKFMRRFLRVLVVGFPLICSVADGQESQSLDIDQLRSVVTRETLTERAFDLSPVVEHLWKRNGGALIVRDSDN